jgi:hypothetical protein
VISARGPGKEADILKPQRLTMLVFVCLVWAASARVDAVVDRNILALQAITTANLGAPLIDLAIVHAAIYDAVQALNSSESASTRLRSTCVRSTKKLQVHSKSQAVATALRRRLV